MMAYERAVEIVEACTANGVYHMLGDCGKDVPSLADYSLAEMVEAQRVVQETEVDRQKPDGKTRSFHTVCADRLVAALYVASHYPGQDGRDVDPICLLPDGRAVVVLDMREALAEAETTETAP